MSFATSSILLSKSSTVTYISFYFSVIGAGSVNLERIYYSLPTIIVLAVIIPLLTMRSFSEERKSGTEQLLLTSPLSITKIVLKSGNTHVIIKNAIDIIAAIIWNKFRNAKGRNNTFRF